LLFAGRDVLKGQNILKRPDAQISPVLPITQETFNQMLARMQNQSNMVVRMDPTKFISQKLADEGSASPFWARLFLGILRLADFTIPDAGKRGEFHKSVDFLINQLLNARSASQEINQIWSDHARRITQGEIASIQGSVIHISENIDAALRKQTESFLGVSSGNGILRTLRSAVSSWNRTRRHLMRNAEPLAQSSGSPVPVFP
jgi:hypothetical protein